MLKLLLLIFVLGCVSLFLINVDSSNDMINSGINSLMKQIEKIFDLLSSSEWSSSSNKFIGNISDLYTQYIDFIGSLPLHKSLAVFNILFLIVLSTILYNIFIIIYADYLIIYFNLKEKWPKLDNFLKYRRTLIQFNLYLYIFIILTSLLAVLFVNVVILVLT